MESLKEYIVIYWFGKTRPIPKVYIKIYWYKIRMGAVLIYDEESVEEIKVE